MPEAAFIYSADDIELVASSLVLPETVFLSGDPADERRPIKTDAMLALLPNDLPRRTYIYFLKDLDHINYFIFKTHGEDSKSFFAINDLHCPEHLYLSCTLDVVAGRCGFLTLSHHKNFLTSDSKKLVQASGNLRSAFAKIVRRLKNKAESLTAFRSTYFILPAAAQLMRSGRGQTTFGLKFDQQVRTGLQTLEAP